MRAVFAHEGAIGSATAATSSISINSKTERNMTRQTAGRAKKFKLQTINGAFTGLFLLYRDFGTS